MNYTVIKIVGTQHAVSLQGSILFRKDHNLAVGLLAGTFRFYSRMLAQRDVDHPTFA